MHVVLYFWWMSFVSVVVYTCAWMQGGLMVSLLYLYFLTQDLSVSQKLIAGRASDSTDELRGSASLSSSQSCGDRHAGPSWVFMWVLEFWIQALKIPRQVLTRQAISVALEWLFYILLYFHRVWAVIVISRLAWKLGHTLSLVSYQTILKLLSVKKRILRNWGRSPPWSFMVKSSGTPSVLISPLCWDQGTNSADDRKTC